MGNREWGIGNGKRGGIGQWARGAYTQKNKNNLSLMITSLVSDCSGEFAAGNLHLV